MQRSEMKFEKSSILRKEMLEDLYAYPRVAAETYYSRFSDGILYGLEWKESSEHSGHHFIMPGALKYHGNIYFLSEYIDVERLLEHEIANDKRYRLCFLEKEVIQNTYSRMVYRLELRAIQSEEYNDKKNQLFYYARVRCTGKNSLELLEDEEAVYGLFAADDGYAFQLPCWLVDKKIRELVEKKERKHPLDYMLLKEFYQGKGLLLSFVKLYLHEAKVAFDENDLQSPILVVNKLVEAISKLQFHVTFINGSGNEESTYDDEELDETGGLLL